jgi:hypothetical protein
MRSRLAYLALCRSIQLLALLARGAQGVAAAMLPLVAPAVGVWREVPSRWATGSQSSPAGTSASVRPGSGRGRVPAGAGR